MGHDTLASTAPVEAARFDVSGVVQGVGFRPFVYRLAKDLELDGLVGNDSTHVFIEVAGPCEDIDEFARRLVADAPPMARIERVTRSERTSEIGAGFAIVAGSDVEGEHTLIPPDTGVCDDCRRELADPVDRRHGHPFITCTNCGPRFTIIRDLPYDRPATTMADFEMCATCRSEYTDPSDRRHHAQPIACPDCGPTLQFRDDESTTAGRPSEAIAAAVAALASGATVAIKGLGGFHLACDAGDPVAIERLRRRKQRPDKPFAIMVADLEAARRVAVVDDAEASQLQSPARPIVLLGAHDPRDGTIAEAVAPGSPLLGVMLPSTPIHHLLFDAGAPPLVMTSGNVNGEPIAFDDAAAAQRLDHLCDAWLTHDRPIHVPCDDSIVRVVGKAVLPIRRARGFAPLPVPVGSARRNVLAVGGELKNAICLASTSHAWMSQHLGDMENLETVEAFERCVDQFEQHTAVTPQVIATDRHPGYRTSAWARANHRDLVVGVQHHHAHIASVMAEHGWNPQRPVLGFAFDGTGYGDDGTIWGGEALLTDAGGYERVGHLEPIDLPGGDAAIIHPCRVALAHLAAAGIDWTDDLAPVGAMTPSELALLGQQLDRRVACVPTTSMGRLFDAVASLLGLRHTISYEAQAAIELETAATRAWSRSGGTSLHYGFGVDGARIAVAAVLGQIVEDLRDGAATDEVALAFHEAVADVVLHVARRVRTERAVNTVVLAGGAFQNVLLTVRCSSLLEGADFEVLTNRIVPPNDGGLALGQAYIAGHGEPISRPTQPEV